mgnify:CR=1 FL=1
MAGEIERLTARPRLPKTVIGLGLVSLFTDASSEAIFPLLPAFLTLLGASNLWIGAIEGAADFVANVLKYLTGLLADRRERLKPLVLAGYSLSTVVRPLVAFAVTPWQVLLVRLFDRVGKGVRTSPRDALIAHVTDPSIRGRAYGFHRAMDHAGAAIGALFSATALFLLGAGLSAESADLGKIRTVFLLAAIPGLFALVALALTPEPPRPLPPQARPRPEPLPRALRSALFALVLFTFANATDAFLIVLATRLGASPALAPLLWLGLHVIKASTATIGGTLADRFGRRNALALGWLVYAVTWGAIGLAVTLPALFLLVGAYGVSHGLVEGAERALVADLAAGTARGRAFGAYNMAIGFAAMVASVAFGAIWDAFGTVPAFLGSASFAVVAAVVLLVLVPNKPSEAPPVDGGTGQSGDAMAAREPADPSSHVARSR